jgi:hypothetical protein
MNAREREKEREREVVFSDRYSLREETFLTVEIVCPCRVRFEAEERMEHRACNTT